MSLASLRDQPGTQREYETIFIVAPDAASEQIQQINDRVRKVLEDANGKLMRIENWGKRKLAYEIRKHNRGIYLYWHYLSSPELIREIERNLRMIDAVIRYMTVKIDEDVDPTARPSDVDDETFVQASQTVPDEEDIALGRVDRSGDDEAAAAATDGDAPAADGAEAAPAEAAADGAEAAPAEAAADGDAAPAEAAAEAAPEAAAEAAPEAAEAAPEAAEAAPEAAAETADAAETSEEAPKKEDDQ